jgi:hypothetical protein
MSFEFLKPRSGTLIIFTPDLSEAIHNETVIKIISSNIHKGNIVIASPSNGPYAKLFSDYGAAVRIGSTILV